MVVDVHVLIIPESGAREQEASHTGVRTVHRSGKALMCSVMPCTAACPQCGCKQLRRTRANLCYGAPAALDCLTAAYEAPRPVVLHIRLRLAQQQRGVGGWGSCTYQEPGQGRAGQHASSRERGLQKTSVRSKGKGTGQAAGAGRTRRSASGAPSLPYLAITSCLFCFVSDSFLDLNWLYITSARLGSAWVCVCERESAAVRQGTHGRFTQVASSAGPPSSRNTTHWTAAGGQQ